MKKCQVLKQKNMHIKKTLECPVFDSFRVQQVAGLFDIPIAQKSSFSLDVEIPGAEEDWQIGSVIGSSGSGKSTAAKFAYGDKLWQSGDVSWPAGKAVIDCFTAPVKEVTQLLTGVGFSSPPAWVKPYSVLSNGEKFRCDLARALLSDNELVVYDEFTSFLDRTVAKVGCAAISKAIRSGRIKKRLVAVSCHSDIVEWLQPDWVVDMATSTLARGSLRRPDITIEIFRCERSAWKLFEKHHYLSSTLHQASACFIATWDGEPVAFCAIQPNMGWKDCWRICRTVVLPDYQGIGIGTKITEAVAEMWIKLGKQVSMITSHPGIIAHNQKSPLWKVKSYKPYGNRKHAGTGPQTGHFKPPVVSGLRGVVSFEYIGATV